MAQCRFLRGVRLACREHTPRTVRGSSTSASTKPSGTTALQSNCTTDLFGSIRPKATIYSDIREIYLDKRLDTHNLELTVRYNNFNPAKSKYRGQGAGNDVKSRFLILAIHPP